MVIGAGFQGHDREGNSGEERVMGTYGAGRREAEGQIIVDFFFFMNGDGCSEHYFKRRRSR